MGSHDKITTVAELAELLSSLRAQGESIVHCHGCFDLLHIGHIRYLQKASRLGDVLVVTVTPDCYVNKGPHRPAFPQAFRAEALAALDCVDYVAINEWPTAVETIELLKPNVYAKGADFRENRTPEIVREELAAAAVGADAVFIEDITSSSSGLINRHLSPFPEDVSQYLAAMSDRFGVEEILRWVEEAGAVKALVVGETMIDEYAYCQTLQRSAHAPVLAMQYLANERFVGGAAAVADHLAAFCGEVGLVSLLGAEQSEETWVRGKLRENVRPVFAAKTGSPTIVRRQYRESYFALPVFELYVVNDAPLTDGDNQQVCALLQEALPQYDMVVVADYGHAMLTAEAIGVLCQGAGHLTVNAQVDAANVGYHTVSRYPRADYLCLAEQELRLECHSRSEDVAPLLGRVADRLATSQAVVMRGSHGCMGHSREGGVQEAPALATRVVDRSGATDAFVAITALCAFRNAPLEVLCFLGNVAGAEAVATTGREPLSKLPLRRYVASLLK